MSHDDSPDDIGHGTEVEREAASLLRAIDAHVFTDNGESRAVERYAVRLRFALDRVAELRRTGAGRLAPVRLEFALEILDNNLRQGAIFADRIVSRLPKPAAARFDRTPAEEPVEPEHSSTDRAA